jgi:hypothetical protein
VAKKSSASSQLERLKRMKSENIWRKPLTETEKDSHINFDGIPPLSQKQLAHMVRARDVRPSKISVSVRLDPRILANVMEAEQLLQKR